MLNPESQFEVELPEEEATLLRGSYEKASVILEYGSGGSTVLAAGMPNKLIFSVESDPKWAMRLQRYLDAMPSVSSVFVQHVDIGPTGSWGRPIGPDTWPRFHLYPMSIWAEPFFRHPDVVLIDGRFRTACLATVAALCERPVTVLFDDYSTRPSYHAVEPLLEPCAIIGRMAVFKVQPGLVTRSRLHLVMDLFAQATYHRRSARYERPA